MNAPTDLIDAIESDGTLSVATYERYPGRSDFRLDLTDERNSYNKAPGKLSMSFYDAVREAGYQVSATHTGVDGVNARVWVERQDKTRQERSIEQFDEYNSR